MTANGAIPIKKGGRGLALGGATPAACKKHGLFSWRFSQLGRNCQVSQTLHFNYVINPHAKPAQNFIPLNFQDSHNTKVKLNLAQITNVDN
jgi:hypothetical protein